MTRRPPRAEDGHDTALRRLLPLLVPVATAGIAVALAAVAAVAVDPPTLSGWLGLAALIGAALLAETSPVPVQKLPTGHVSLAAVFFVGTAVVHGPAEAALMAGVVRIAVDAMERRPRVRLIYNASAYALAGAAAGGVAAIVGTATIGLLVVAVVTAAAIYYVVNVTLISAAIGRWTDESFLPLLRTAAVA